MKNRLFHSDTCTIQQSLDTARSYNLLNQRSGYFLFNSEGISSFEDKQQAIVITDIHGRSFIMQMDSDHKG